MYGQRDPLESYFYGLGELRPARLKRSQIDTSEGVLVTIELRPFELSLRQALTVSHCFIVAIVRFYRPPLVGVLAPARNGANDYTGSLLDPGASWAIVANDDLVDPLEPSARNRIVSTGNAFPLRGLRLREVFVPQCVVSYPKLTASCRGPSITDRRRHRCGL